MQFLVKIGSDKH